VTEYDWLNFVLPFAFGAVGFLVALLGSRMTRSAKRRVQFTNANDKLMGAIHDLVRLKSEVVVCEMEIQEHLDTMPIDRARWVNEMRQIAHSIPPLVLLQLKRFGLAEPPPELEHATQQSAMLAPADVSAAQPGHSAEVIPWTGRANTG
jgi:hypothetical protein